MAIVDYQISILPKISVHNRFTKNLPLHLLDHSSEWELTRDEIFDIEDDDVYNAVIEEIYGAEVFEDDYEYNFWDNKKVFLDVENKLKGLFSINDKPWADCQRYYGFEKGVRLDFWDEVKGDGQENLDVGMRIKVNEVDYNFLKQILDILFSLDMLLVVGDTGKIISADYETFLKIFHSSKRYKRFSSRPISPDMEHTPSNQTP